jgi:hypothetical protein
MAYFPQLAQFPARRRLVQRTVVTRQAGGTSWKLADPAEAAIEWELDLKGLTAAECGAIDSLFESVEGRLGTFAFLDPFDNLLKWSEDLSADEWVKDPLLDISGAMVINPGPGELALQQSVRAPAWFQYCFSAYARGGQVRLFARAGSQTTSQTFVTGEQWQRLELQVMPGGTEENIVFGAAIPEGAAVEMYGFQVEPQPAASAYKKTTAHSGVHAAARFLDDALEVTADGVENYSLLVRIRSPLD